MKYIFFLFVIFLILHSVKSKGLTERAQIVLTFVKLKLRAAGGKLKGLDCPYLCQVMAACGRLKGLNERAQIVLRTNQTNSREVNRATRRE